MSSLFIICLLSRILKSRKRKAVNFGSDIARIVLMKSRDKWDNLNKKRAWSLLDQSQIGIYFKELMVLSSSETLDGQAFCKRFIWFIYLISLPKLTSKNSFSPPLSYIPDCKKNVEEKCIFQCSIMYKTRNVKVFEWGVNRSLKLKQNLNLIALHMIMTYHFWRPTAMHWR